MSIRSSRRVRDRYTTHPNPGPSLVLSNRHPQRSELLPAVPRNAPQEHNGIEGSYVVIQARLASHVCHHLLAGCGYFSHNSVSSAAWPAAYGILPHNHVKSVLQMTYEFFKDLINDRSLTYKVVLPASAFQSSGCAKDVTFQGIETWPRSIKGSIPKSNTFAMNLSNRASSNKHIAFAALCLSWNHPLENSSDIYPAKTILQNMRAEGYGAYGCIVFSGMKFGEIESCQRSSTGSCLEGNYGIDGLLEYASPLFQVTRSGPKTVAEGVVQPCVKRVGHEEVPSGFFAVLITKSIDGDAVYETPTTLENTDGGVMSTPCKLTAPAWQRCLGRLFFGQ